jgi:hypothetical protein
MQNQDFFDAQEEHHKAISHYRIGSDKKRAILPEHLYQEIMEKGVKCSTCGIVVDKDIYGRTVRNPDKIVKVQCCYCTSINDV